MAARTEQNSGELMHSKRALKAGSWLPEGLHERLLVAFCLMSVIPLLVLGYVLSTYVFPQLDFSTQFSWGSLSASAGIAVLLTLTGWYLIRGVGRGVVRMVSDARAIASGEYERGVVVEGPRELGDLGEALNRITQRVRDNMDQLRAYGEETRQLNLEINKKILSFSDLLQISNLITQSGKIDEILGAILGKMCTLDDVESSCLLELMDHRKQIFHVRAITQAPGLELPFWSQQELTAPWFWQLIRDRQTLVLDVTSGSTTQKEIFQQLLGVTHAVLQPISVLGKEWGILISASGQPRARFRKDGLELLKVFAKQMTIALENNALTQRASELEIVDELTGLYNASYMKNRLDEEIHRSIRFHHPCSYSVVNLDHFRRFQEAAGGLAAEKVLRDIAHLLKAQVSDVDRVGRVGLDEFALILPERNKREAISLVEQMRLLMEERVFARGANPAAPKLTLSAGVSENPLDGSTAESLLAKAEEALRKAKQNGKNRVVAA